MMTELPIEPLPLRERNKQKVTQRIITVAVELFKTQGYAQTTIDDIAAEADVSRRTLFNYFPSKEALLLPWAHEILEGHIYPTIAAYLDTQPPTIECVRLLFTVIAESIAASPDVVQAFMYESMQTHGVSTLDVGNGVQEIFLQIVRYGQTREEVRVDLPAEHLAHYLSALLTPLLFRLFAPAVPNQPLDLETLLAFIKSGLAPSSLH
jgi:AcrR family transcriptional regulator